MKHNHNPIHAAAWLIFPLLLVTSGCGNGLSRVEGQITLDGSPLACGEDVSGTICFYPENGAGAPAVGRIDDDGNYRINTGAQSGMAEGAYLVTVRASKFLPSDNADAPRPSRLLTPPQFNDPKKSGFRVEVGPGSNVFDFEMQTPTRQARRSRR